MNTYLVCDYSNCKEGDGFKTEQIKYLKEFAKKSDAISYYKKLKSNAIGIEEWGLNKEGLPESFLDSVIVKDSLQENVVLR